MTTTAVDAEPKKRSGILVWLITGGLAVIVAVGLLILWIYARPVAVGLWHWYSAMPGGGEAKEALTVSASVAVVIWTGGLISFSVKGVSIELRGALLLLEYAFIGPMLALFTSGAVIRTIALVAVLYCCGRAIRHAIFYVGIRRRFASPDAGGSDAAGVSESVLGRELRSTIPHVLNFPSVYVGICALGSLAVLVYPMNVTVACASMGGVVGGLNLVLLTIERAGTVPNPQVEAAATQLEIAATQRKDGVSSAGEPGLAEAGPDGGGNAASREHRGS